MGSNPILSFQSGDVIMFKKDTVFVCGEYRKYKNMPKKQTVEHQKEVEKITESFKPIIRESEMLIEKQRIIQEEIDDLNDYYDLLKREDNPDLEEIRNVQKERANLRKKLREAQQDIIEFNDSQDERISELDTEIPKRLAVLASNMVEITPEEFLEKYTEEDELLIRHLSFFKQMHDARHTDAEMEHLWKEIIDNNIRNSLNLNPS